MLGASPPSPGCASGHLQEEVLGRKLSVVGLELAEFSAWHCQPCVPTLALALLS